MFINYFYFIALIFPFYLKKLYFLSKISFSDLFARSFSFYNDRPIFYKTFPALNILKRKKYILTMEN